ncbi:hypothetical protein SDC9_168314 [bioreactor metagenome]|uniref:Uncharacterized protein n=1 Tax=bioreactor metagenome TaxID=1076179 RepID=A0A645G2T0_9ZZZZ
MNEINAGIVVLDPMQVGYPGRVGHEKIGVKHFDAVPQFAGNVFHFLGRVHGEANMRVYLTQFLHHAFWKWNCGQHFEVLGHATILLSRFLPGQALLSRVLARILLQHPLL